MFCNQLKLQYQLLSDSYNSTSAKKYHSISKESFDFWLEVTEI